MKPQGKVRIKWSPEFAYAVGLIVTDGCLTDGRHINLTSKDEEQITNFKRCLNLGNQIGKKSRGGEFEKKYFVIQFGDVQFYEFLNSIGITAHKSKTIGAIEVPDEYFFDFLRGLHDGDGTFYSYWDPRWRSSYMFYTVFLSAGRSHIEWIQDALFKKLNITGHMTMTGTVPMYQVKYAKAESLKLLPKMYYNAEVVCLSRKRKKIEAALAVEGRLLTN